MKPIRKEDWHGSFLVGISHAHFVNCPSFNKSNPIHCVVRVLDKYQVIFESATKTSSNTSTTATWNEKMSIPINTASTSLFLEFYFQDRKKKNNNKEYPCIGYYSVTLNKGDTFSIGMHAENLSSGPGKDDKMKSEIYYTLTFSADSSNSLGTLLPLPKSPSKLESVYWEWKDKDVWIQYDNDISKEIEAAYLAKKKNVTLTSGWYSKNGPYVINFETLKQLNQKTNFKREIRRQTGTPPVHAMTKMDTATATRTDVIYKWEYENKKKWEAYDAESSRRLEEAYNMGKKAIQVTLDHATYNIDFYNQTQTNMNTTHVRKIRRIEAESKASEDVPDLQSLFFDRAPLTLTVKSARDIGDNRMHSAYCRVMLEAFGESTIVGESETVKKSKNPTFNYTVNTVIKTLGSSSNPAKIIIELWDERDIECFLGQIRLPLWKYADNNAHDIDFPLEGNQRKGLSKVNGMLQVSLRFSAVLKELIPITELDKRYKETVPTGNALSAQQKWEQIQRNTTKLDMGGEEFISLIRESRMKHENWVKLQKNLSEILYQSYFVENRGDLWIIDALSLEAYLSSSPIRNYKLSPSYPIMLQCLAAICQHSQFPSVNPVYSLFSLISLSDIPEQILLFSIFTKISMKNANHLLLGMKRFIMGESDTIFQNLVHELGSGKNLKFKVEFLSFLNSVLVIVTDDDRDTLVEELWELGLTFQVLNSVKKNFPDPKIIEQVNYYLYESEITETGVKEAPTDHPTETKSTTSTSSVKEIKHIQKEVKQIGKVTIPDFKSEQKNEKSVKFADTPEIKLPDSHNVPKEIEKDTQTQLSPTKLLQPQEPTQAPQLKGTEPTSLLPQGQEPAQPVTQPKEPVQLPQSQGQEHPQPQQSLPQQPPPPPNAAEEKANLPEKVEPNDDAEDDTKFSLDFVPTPEFQKVLGNLLGFPNKPPPPPGVSQGGPPPPPPPGGPPPPPSGGPPPPPSRGPPGPPPPPGAKQEAPKKQIVQIRLNKINPNQINGTIFQEMKALKNTNINSKELLDLFTKPDSKPVEVSQPNPNDKPKGKEVTINLDPKRSMELGIFLSKHLVDMNILLHSIKTFTLSPAVDDKFYRLLPEKFMIKNEKNAVERNIEKEECDNFTKSGGKTEQLNNVAKFVYLMWSIPRLPERMKILQFKLEWYSIQMESDENARILFDTLKELESVHFKQILKYVLTCANTLNNSETIGFTMSSLMKLRDIKSPTNKSLTMLHYVASIIVKDTPVSEWSQKILPIVKRNLTAITVFQGVFPIIIDNLITIEKEMQLCELPADHKYLSNLSELKDQLVTQSEKLTRDKNKIDKAIAFLGGNKNDQADDENIRQIRAMWNNYRDIFPTAALKAKVEHDESTYTFFYAICSFFDDLEKAKAYLESIKEKPKEKESQKKPGSMALRKRMGMEVQPGPPEPTILTTTIPNSTTRKATIFRKKTVLRK